MLLSLGLGCPGPPQGPNNHQIPPPSPPWRCRYCTHSRRSRSLPVRQCPGRLEARSEACSALSLKPKQEYLFNFPNNQWCHPTISSSVVAFSSCFLSLPTSESFLMSWLFASGGPSIGASASISVLPMNIQSWFPLGLTGLISLLSKELKRVFYSTTVRKHRFFRRANLVQMLIFPGDCSGKLLRTGHCSSVI